MSRGWPYHTFVSFRGEDIRHGFIGYLRHNLQQRGIRLFIDDDIVKGEYITDTLIQAIEDSQTGIIVFSKNYASSSFCLRELVHMQRCIQGHGRTIWVVFYDVDPSDVRHQKNSYETAFQRYDNEKIKYDEKEVSEWRMALTKAADVCGWHWKKSRDVEQSGRAEGMFTRHGDSFSIDDQQQPSWQQESSVQSSFKTYEHAFVEEIIDVVSKVINHRRLTITQFPVGLEAHIEEVCKRLKQEPNDDGATMVGIWGIGGIGKTTLARAVYNEIGKDFKHLCFLASIRENSIRELAKTMLSKTISEKGEILDNVDELTIPSIIRDKLCNKKILLILDDIWELKQLQALAGEPNWFGYGSKILITTRDKGLLLKHNIAISRIYNIELLRPDQANELLRLHVFGKKSVGPTYEDVINRAVKYAGGLPLVLEVLGSHLSAHQTIEDWEGVLDMYERIPEKTVLKTLRVSYDGLEQIQQQIFLDIACFYRGKSLEYVADILGSSHDFPRPKSCIRVLIERSILKIDEDEFVQMHDLIQDMGQEIVRQESTELGKRSRLWSTNDFLHVLDTDSGSEHIQAIDVVHGPDPHEVNWNGEAFKKMTCLRQLTIGRDAPSSQGHVQHQPNILSALKLKLFSQDPIQYLPNSLRVLEWKFFPSLTLPHDFDPCNLAILKLTESKLRTLEEPSRNFPYLRHLDLSYCDNLKEIPNMSRAPNLETLKVLNCRNLTKIDDSIGRLKKLKELKATGSHNLKTFSKGVINFPSLEILDLLFCSSLKKFPKVLEEMKILRTLNLRHSGIKELPESIEKLVGLQHLNLTDCTKLREMRGIPPNIQILTANNCTKLTSHSRRRLLSEELHKSGRKRFILPGENIPEWFPKQSEGRSICFSFRNKFPDITVCVVFHFGGETHYYQYYKLEFEILLNGARLIIDDPDDFFISTHHVYLLNLKRQDSLSRLEGEVLKEEWNEVVIKCDSYAVKCIGVYACDYERCKYDVDWNYRSFHRSQIRSKGDARR